MIYDTINNIDNYKTMNHVYKALRYLKDNTITTNTILIENKLFCNVVEFITKDECDCKYEAHKKYIDIHYILSGEEIIATSDVTSLSTITPYNPQSDIYFLEGIADGHYLLQAGNFMICFPNDAHKVCIMNHQPQHVKKIVFKILAED